MAKLDAIPATTPDQPPVSTRAALALALLIGGLQGRPATGAAEPPAPPREFRGVWVATVGNIDWPSRPGLDVEAQQREGGAILDLAVRTGLNAVVLQVRSAADALYESPVEPWSAYLSGRQGEAPAPGYDPLAWWVAEAHARGVLLHAWINPFRARIAGAKSAEAPTHVARTHPELVRRYGDALWLDPGEPEARALTLRVVADIARRYDVDGVHVDDYFYPYPIADPDHPGRELPFPDDASWARAQAAGATMARGDWRRDNVNRFIEGMAAVVHAERPRALVGISPFGIVRPGMPAGVVGFDPYDKLAADAGLWFRRGWCDYLAPQLYWKVDAPGQPFRPLLDHWASLNERGRHLWPGLALYRVGDGPKEYAPAEILRQVEILRGGTAATGAILFSFKAIPANRRGVADALRDGPYREPALVSPTPWLGVEAPPRPTLTRAADEPAAGQGSSTLAIAAAADPFVWAVQGRVGDGWTFAVRPGRERRLVLDGALRGALAVAVRGVDRLGNAGEPAIWTDLTPPPSP